MKDSLTKIISLIVDDPKAVSVDEKEEDGVLHLIISVASSDVGKVIGKNGKIIRALRSVMKIPAVKQNKRIYISIAETTAE